MKYLFLSLILSGSFAWAETFTEKRVYRNLVGGFETEQECEDYKKETGSWFNCFQVVTFNTDGSASVLLSDIMNLAEYSISEENKITLKEKINGDMPETMTFLILNDDQIRSCSQGEIWNRHVSEEEN